MEKRKIKKKININFLVDPKTRNVLQVEYPSDLAKFNEILGTSEGKNKLMKELGIIVNG